MAGVLLAMSAVFLPETLRKKRLQVIEKTMDIEQDKSHVTKIETPSFFSTLRTSFKPMVTMLHDPTVLILTVYNSVIFACLYFLVTIKSVFMEMMITELYFYRIPQSPTPLKNFTVTLNGKSAFVILQ